MISRQALIIRPERLHIGNNVRIDAFSIISCGDDGIFLDGVNHVAAAAKLYGQGGRIRLERFAQISSNAIVYTEIDDFSRCRLAGPMVSRRSRTLINGEVTLRRGAVVGAAAVIFPGVEIGRFSAIGALSLVKSNIPRDEVHAGVPAKKIRKKA